MRKAQVKNDKNTMATFFGQKCFYSPCLNLVTTFYSILYRVSYLCSSKNLINGTDTSYSKQNI